MAYPVPQSDPTSVIGRRVLAVLIDALIVIVPAIIAMSSQFEYLEVPSSEAAEQFCDVFLEQQGGFCFNAADIDDRVYFSDDANPGANLVYWGLNFGLLVLLQGFTGWTPGKLVTGIRVVREDGRPPGFVKALLRWLLWIGDGFPYFIPGLTGFIVGLTTTGHRRLGDMVAKTFVVKKAAAGAPIVVPGMATTPPGGWGTPPPGAPGAPAGWGPAVDPNAAGWASPAPPPPASSPPPPPSAPPPPAAPVAPAAPPTGGPQWDEARGTYIQWDPAQGAWMQWDEGFKAWSRIPGQ